MVGSIFRSFHPLLQHFPHPHHTFHRSKPAVPGRAVPPSGRPAAFLFSFSASSQDGDRQPFTRNGKETRCRAGRAAKGRPYKSDAGFVGAPGRRAPQKDEGAAANGSGPLILFSYFRLKKASLPRYCATSPSSSSMRRSWLYLATRSVRLGAPVLIWPALRATAMSAMVASSVSPER